MEAKIDSGGRVLLPKQYRQAFGLTAGATVDVSPYGRGLQITPAGRTAVLVRNADGRLVATSDEALTDDMMFSLIDAGRR
ncbi:MAG: AbrB/MazE/SpoVT family DNA-binding domain-containing protein [Propionibacteriaceae bacterium]|nr:AbrB/MazE/SpoVT family DNA-binding domain-containing protein [Propionibacteriaceae bacterium]